MNFIRKYLQQIKVALDNFSIKIIMNIVLLLHQNNKKVQHQNL